MTEQLEAIFSYSGAFAMAGWAALAVAPLARHRLVLAARLVVIGLCFGYLVEFAAIGAPVTGAGFQSLAGVTALFAQPGNVMIGWTHYLAFDLAVGSWQVEDAPGSKLPHWLVMICLTLTLLAGPIGLLAYVIVRTVARKRSSTAQ